MASFLSHSLLGHTGLDSPFRGREVGAGIRAEQKGWFVSVDQDQGWAPTPGALA